MVHDREGKKRARIYTQFGLGEQSFYPFYLGDVANGNDDCHEILFQKIARHLFDSLR